jgi:hypothetical protein
MFSSLGMAALYAWPYAGLADIDTDLEKLAMDPRRAPERICDADLADQLSYFERHHRPPTTACRLPAPVQPKTRAMPANNGVRFHDRQRIANAKPIEANKNQSVDGVEGLFLRSGSAQDVYLLPQRQNFRLERCPRPKQIYDHPNNEFD